MGETAGQSVRTIARIAALGVPLLFVMGVLGGACAETRAPIGSACLKSEDCLSGICSQLVCAAQPPTTSSPPLSNPDASATAETGSTEAAAEAAPEASPEAAPESSTGGDGATPEAAGD